MYWYTFKDNDAVVMSTIINKLQHISRNRRFLICEGAKLIRLLLLSQVHKNILWVKHGKQPTGFLTNKIFNSGFSGFLTNKKNPEQI